MCENDASKDQSSEQRRRELIDAARRQVEEACGAMGGDPVSSSSAPTRIAEDASPPGASSHSFSLPPADSFAGYKILREIHRGAQGVVYQAIQESMKRKVAIKVMKEGPFASSAERARFDREVTLLGQLSHPNIVTIHGTGEAGGCLYFVMDYISGQPLDVYMASEKRAVDETLRLFAEICEAVESAHLRGIIHRDLKPSNIRVDTAGKPYVLDFGLAKSASDADASMTAMTGRFLGTPAWASPEQADGIPSNIDIRSDVYSLGVILYQMLTGRFPYKVTGSTQEVMDRIRKTDPLRPRDLRREVNDEVETIVLKCLSKDRIRRYQSAGELARDVQRYLAGEPIEAKRDSLSYVFGKQLRRYKPQATVAASFLFVIILALVTSVWLLSDARQAEASEREHRKQAEDYAEELKLARISIEAKHRALKENQSLANKLFDDIAEYLKQDWSPENAVVESGLRHIFGRNCRRVGRLDEAEENLTLALDIRRETSGEEHADTLDSANELGRVYLKQGERRYEDASQLYHKTLASCRRVLGSENRITLDCMSNLALLYKSQDRYEEAMTLLEDVIATRTDTIGQEHEDTLNSMNNLAALLAHTGRLDEAAKLHETVLAIRRRVLDENHRYTLNSMSSLGGVYTLQGRYEEAEKLLLEALAGAKLTLEKGSANTGTYLKYYGRLLLRTGRFKEAEEALLESHAIISSSYGEQDSRTVAVLQLLVKLYTQSEQPGKSEIYSDLILQSQRDNAEPLPVE